MKPSHILTDLEELAKLRQLQAASFNPDCFSVKNKKERIDKARTDDLFFCKEYFPEEFYNDFGGLHRDWANIYNSKNREIHLVAGPRRFGKSMELRALRIKKMIFKTFRHGMRVGENLEDAEREVLASMLEFELNPRLLYDFGDLRDKRFWTRNEMRLKNGSTFRPMSPNIKARGLNPEPDYVEIDDFEDEESAANPERGKKKLNWLIKELYNATSKNAGIIWLANNLSLDSACNQFIEDITENPRSRFFVHVYKALTVTADGQFISTWPGGWTVEELLDLKANIGTVAFEAEMQQNPMRPGEFFKNEWLQYADYDELEKRKDELYGGIFIDPSYGETDAACYKAMVFMVTDKKRFYIVDAWIRQSSISAMCYSYYEFVRRYQKWNLMFHRYESVMGQKLLIRDFREVGEKLDDSRLPGFYEDKTPKPVRIEGLSMPLETGRLVFVTRDGKPSPDMQRLIEQFMNYPRGFIDGPDATGSCYKILSNIARTENQPWYKSLSKRRNRWRV